MAWEWIYFQQFFIFGWTIPLRYQRWVMKSNIPITSQAIQSFPDQIHGWAPGDWLKKTLILKVRAGLMPARHSWISYAYGGQKPRVHALIEPIRDARWEKSLKAAGNDPMGKKTGFSRQMSFATTEAFAINSMTVSTRTGKLISNFAVGLQILSSLKVIEIILILLDLLNMSKTDWKKCICYLSSVLMDKNCLYNIIYCIAGFGVLEQWKKAAKNKLHSSKGPYSSWACRPAKCFRCERRWEAASEWMQPNTKKARGSRHLPFKGILAGCVQALACFCETPQKLHCHAKWKTAEFKKIPPATQLMRCA